jgi:DNA repair exonuclease SbcCD ATPase subunit
MNIVQLTVSGYKRLLLNNIRTLTLTPTTLHQLILGTNGCGKSSLLYELSPLPAQSAQYCAGGYKEILIDFEGLRYTLTSTFDKTQQHSFLKDGQECNPGHTLTVQRDLVKQTFGLDQALHELMIGQTQFTALSPAKRREWMTKLCPIDFDYALSVHQRLKQQTRDEQGALKHIQHRIHQETQTLNETSAQQAIDAQYQTLHDELTQLFQHQTRQEHSADTHQQHLNRLLEQCQHDAKTLIKTRPTPPNGHNARSMAEVEHQYTELKTTIHAHHTLRSRLCEEHDQLTALITSIDQAGVESTEAIEHECGQLRERITALIPQCDVWPTLQVDPLLVQRTFYDTQSLIVERIKALPANPNRYYTKAKQQTAKTQRSALEQEIEHTQLKGHRYKKELAHLEALRDVTCPRCEHRWVPGFDQQRYESLNQALTQWAQTLESLNQRHQQLSAYIDESIAYHEALSHVRAIEQHYPPLTDLYTTLINDERFFEAPELILDWIQRFANAIDAHVTIASHKTRLQELEALLKQPQAINQKQGIETRCAQLTAEIQTLSETLETKQRECEAIKRYQTQLTAYFKRVEAFDTLLSTIQTTLQATIDAQRNEQLSALIQSHQCQLAQLQQQRSAHQAAQTVLTDLQHSKQQLQHDTVLLDTLTRLISPTEGLIAEALGEFLGQFVDHVNSIIASIWTYDLTIQPCSLEDGELDYRFPIETHHDGQHTSVPDIAKGSEAQVDVINFAVRLVTMTYLGFQHYPIFIDELGRSFDEQHRLNLLTFLKQFLEQNLQRQLFMVSHFANQFGIFTNADVLVLDATNITTPQHYNHHVRLE